jgi:hypothetical protein
MSRGGHENPAITSPSYICCGQRLKQIDVTTKVSDLSFTFCSRCEGMRWFRNGVAVATEAARSELATTSPGSTLQAAGH